ADQPGGASVPARIRRRRSQARVRTGVRDAARRRQSADHQWSVAMARSSIDGRAHRRRVGRRGSDARSDREVSARPQSRLAGREVPAQLAVAEPAMTAITFPDFVDDRAEALRDRGLDGLKLALVSLPSGPNPDHADIELHFFNGLHIAAILADIGGDPVRARQVFRIRGGSRIVAGIPAGQVRVTAASGIDATRLSLRVEPVGDYSSYTLELVWNASLIDPFFSAIGFKFRPGCFTNDCAPPL